MAHALEESSAIFSPSVARLAATNARDWSFVDSWLASKFSGRPVPTFERNPSTLKALLTLAALNETADEERNLVATTDEFILRDMKSHLALKKEKECSATSSGSLTSDLSEAVESQLNTEGFAALNAIASLAILTGQAQPEPEQLGRHVVEVQGDIYELEQSKARVDILHAQVEREIAQVTNLLNELQTKLFQPQPGLAKTNLELQRKIKSTTSQLSEQRDGVPASAISSSSSYPSIYDVSREEQEYLCILSHKKDLDSMLASFEGLPSDMYTARSELESLRTELRGFTSQRDAVFEGLVERESPARRR